MSTTTARGRIGHTLRSTACAALLLLAAGAQAAPITVNISFSLSDFVDAVGALAPPQATLSGDVNVTYEPGVATADTATGLTINSLSFTPASMTVFGIGAGGRFSLGGSANGAGIIGVGSTDFVLQLNLADLAAPALFTCADPGFNCGPLTGNASVLSSAYTVAGTSGAWFARAGSLTVTPVSAPGGLALAALGLAMLAGTRRRG
jgi:MYXO-CTERM domain-containing protein